MYWFADGPGYAGGGIGCVLIGLLVVGGLAALAFWWFRRKPEGPAGRGGSSGHPKRTSAEEVLAERYARGELTDEEYWERLSVLREAQRN